MKNKQTLILIVLMLFSILACNRQGEKSTKKQKLIVFHAGSLSIPFKQMKNEFEKLNADVEILLESAGSVQCARKITDLKKECDIIASADYSVIDEMLIPEYTNWNIKFASNEMCIVYHHESKYANEINSQNWPEILLRDDVFFGRSDPNSDPCGYRAILTTQLAEKYYNLPGLTKKISAKDNEYIRPKEVDLLALLESNTIDYIFLYRSVAEQHELEYVILPDSINLKNPELKDFYKNASVEITGKTPGSKITKTGQPMVYGISVLNEAPNKELALQFVDFILSEDKGMQIMEKNGQPSVIPALSETYNAVPEKLKTYTKSY
jgi:molybdate/tungstate transport system substrate-binding protein